MDKRGLFEDLLIRSANYKISYVRNFGRDSPKDSNFARRAQRNAELVKPNSALGVESVTQRCLGKRTCQNAKSPLLRIISLRQAISLTKANFTMSARGQC